MSELIVSVSGIRGVVGESLTRQTIEQFTAATSRVLDAGCIVVTRDGRASGVELAKDVCRTLSDRGRTGVDAGIAATPTTGVLIRQLQAAGGIQVSASHNPVQYNGLKLFDQTGRYVEKFIGDATLSKSGLTYMMTNAKPNRLREMARLEPQKRFSNPTSVHVDDEFNMYVTDYGRYRVQIYKKEAYPLSAVDGQISPPFTAPTLMTT